MRLYKVTMGVAESDNGRDFKVVCDWCGAILYASTDGWDAKNNTPRAKLVGCLVFNHSCFLIHGTAYSQQEVVQEERP